METRIWFSGSWRNIKPTDPILTTKAMHSFCTFNSIPDALLKTQGGGRQWESPQGETKYFNTIEAWRILPKGDDSKAPETPVNNLTNSFLNEDYPF